MFKSAVTKDKSLNGSVSCESQAKSILDEYYSVQFFINGKGPGYLFKLRNMSSNRACILVKHDSCVCKALRVGDILDMEYNPPESFGVGTLLKTRITSKIPHDCYTGHSIVELSVIDN